MVVDIVVDKIALVYALVELIKGIDKGRILEQFYPLFSIVLGISLSILMMLPELNWQVAVIMGLIYGLSASGFYSGTKTVATRGNKK